MLLASKYEWAAVRWAKQSMVQHRYDGRTQGSQSRAPNPNR
jgi:hypothetical protein